MARKLHIGGIGGAKVSSEEWEILNISPGPYVSHVCNANDLSQFADDTFTEIYASHIVEHFDYQGELVKALSEWQRVLEPAGKVYISVPDLDTLAELLLAKDQLTVAERYSVMRMIFGGHMDRSDYHITGLNEEFLGQFLRDAGFINIKRVKDLGLFYDTSCMKFKGVLISLNMIAEKPLYTATTTL